MAVPRGPLPRAAIHFVKRPARCLQGPEEVGEHRPPMLANCHPCQEWCVQHLPVTRSDQDPCCEPLVLRQQAGAWQSWANNQPNSPNMQTEKSSLRSAAEVEMPKIWHRQCGELKGKFGTNDPEVIIGTRRSAMQQHHPGRLHVRQQWDHLDPLHTRA